MRALTWKTGVGVEMISLSCVQLEFFRVKKRQEADKSIGREHTGAHMPRLRRRTSVSGTQRPIERGWS